ncbi:MAG: SpoIIE family protein phosphatase [Anaerolineae bacterium]|nr:SpoIIE family protein phosphatase [Anaerolineae bacterium]
MGPRPKILIVDDEPFNVDYLEQELEDFDYDTVSAANGREALAQVAAEKPDVVLLDIMMPELDGFQVLERLKADLETRDLPVIVISAMNDLKSVVRGIELGAEDYLPKPFEPVLLRARLEASLEKKRLRDQEHLYLKGLERELEIGRQIQAGFLPEALPQPPGWEIAAYFQAAREVAGDFYDVFPLARGEKVGLVLGDVCGKGVGAALFMTLFRSLIRVSAMTYFAGAAPAAATAGPSSNDDVALLEQTIALTNNYVARTHQRASMFASLFLGVLNPATGVLVYVNGGHEAPVIVGPAGVKTSLGPTGPVVGIFAGITFKIQQVQLDLGDMWVGYTDGVTDALSPDEEMFSRENLMALLAQPAPSAPVLLDQIEAGLQAHVAGANQYDDITLLAVRRVAEAFTQVQTDPINR